MKHTPAPWVVDETASMPDELFSYVSVGNCRVAIRADTPSMPTYEQHLNEEWWNAEQERLIAESNANTYLIAAAPDLLEACEATLMDLEDMSTEEFSKGADKQARIRLKEAIKKAKKRI